MRSDSRCTLGPRVRAALLQRSAPWAAHPPSNEGIFFVRHDLSIVCKSTTTREPGASSCSPERGLSSDEFTLFQDGVWRRGATGICVGPGSAAPCTRSRYDRSDLAPPRSRKPLPTRGTILRARIARCPCRTALSARHVQGRVLLESGLTPALWRSACTGRSVLGPPPHVPGRRSAAREPSAPLAIGGATILRKKSLI